MTTPTPVETQPAEPTPVDTTPTETPSEQYTTPSEENPVTYTKKTRYHLVTANGAFVGATYENEDDAFTEALSNDPGYGVLPVSYPEVVKPED